MKEAFFVMLKLTHYHYIYLPDGKSVRIDIMRKGRNGMEDRTRFLGFLSALVSFALCLGAGAWILSKVGLDTGDQALTTGIGLYFVGKAFFVGPMLFLKTLETGKK